MRDPLLVEIEKTIIDFITSLTEYQPTFDDLSKPLKDFGLTSVQGMLLFGELEDTYSIDIKHDLLLGNDTLAAFSFKIYELIKG